MNDIESQLALLLGADALVTDSGAREKYLVDWTRMTSGTADAIVRPASTADVARCVAWCADHGIGVVPQGGHTGLVGGATPVADQRQVVLSLERLNKVREVDPIANTMTVEAGAILQQVQQAADAQDRLFPLSLGAEGSCQIGGCISTNAGGTAVLRYGNTRELVLGLEVVLPDGSIWSKLRTLRKDNAGFDLKHLFIGTEGTLGIVTAATLRLFPKPRQTVVALVAVPGTEAVLDLFVRVRNAFDAELTAFEFMTGQAMALSCSHLGRATPLPAETPFAVLLEVSSPHPGDSLSEALLSCLQLAAEADVVTDAALASSQQQADFFWTLRESIPEAMLRAYAQRSGHDISLPITRIPEFMQRADDLIASRWPQLRTLLFGHVGDGNLHFNFIVPEAIEAAEFRRVKTEATEAIYRLTEEFAGSISAEHGVGVHKKEMLQRLAPATHLALMRKLKDALDGRGLMNPGKVVPAA
ncbi:MAG TPA: FAD-binding oxidoreductase [Ramlibacter sp.]|nr:FAD-binding oxidoreductase [Ramlibacter sp.]